MLSFPLSAILIPFGILALVAVFFAFINMRNLIRYRAEDFLSFFALFIFVSGLAVICYMSWGYLAEIDWTKTIEFGLPSVKIKF